MKEFLLLIIEFLGGSVEILPNSKNPKKAIVSVILVLAVVFLIIYLLTKDF